MANPVSKDDIQAINHINYVSNNIHSLTNDLYEELMDRDHEKAKQKAKSIINIMNAYSFQVQDV